MTSRPAGYTLYANDYLYIDGVEDLTVVSADGNTTAASAKGRRDDLDKLEASGSIIEVSSEDLVFVLYDTTLDGYEPTGRAKITADGVNYRVRAARSMKYGTQWRCICREEV